MEPRWICGQCGNACVTDNMTAHDDDTAAADEDANFSASDDEADTSDPVASDLLRLTPDRLCCVCMEAGMSVLLLPCKHLCLCSACFSRIYEDPVRGGALEGNRRSQRRLCPICSTPITQVVEGVFF